MGKKPLPKRYHGFRKGLSSKKFFERKQVFDHYDSDAIKFV